MHRYRLKGGAALYDAVCRIDDYLQQSENMKTRLARLAGGGYMLHARVRGGSQRRWVGLDKTITIMLRRAGDGCISVEISGLKWRDKAIVMAVSLLVLWQLMLPALWGLYEQMRLPARLARQLREHFDLELYAKTDL